MTDSCRPDRRAAGEVRRDALPPFCLCAFV